jgi:hypothetical protein
MSSTEKGEFQDLKEEVHSNTMVTNQIARQVGQVLQMMKSAKDNSSN